MKTRRLQNIIAAIFIAGSAMLGGCVFNVDRVTQQKSGQISSDGLSRASVDMKSYSGNITVNGTADSLVKATVTFDEMMVTGSPKSAADQVSVAITRADTIGSVTFANTGDDDLWEQLRIGGLEFTCNSVLNVSAKTTNGNISESGIAGALSLETTSGNVTADVVSGCEISVTSGNIDVTMKPDSAFANATLKTTSGNIKIHAPKGFAADLELKTTSGNINTPGGDHSRLNGGDSAVVISCTATSGNIRIEEY
jgi:DUF4097 and DUF4098 domain-containing protein YvlB